MASSAFVNSAASSMSSPEAVQTPTLAETGTSCPAKRTGADRASTSFAASLSAPCGSLKSGSRTTNSSPPILAAEALFALAQKMGLLLQAPSERNDPDQYHQRPGQHKSQQHKGVAHCPPRRPLHHNHVVRRTHQNPEGLGHRLSAP